MARFCTQCGEEAKAEHKVCVYCGTPLKNNSEPDVSTATDKSQQENSQMQESEEETVQKEITKTATNTTDKALTKQPRKRNVLYIVIGAVALVLIIFSMWAKSYQSPDNVLKRFEKALDNENVNQVAKLMTHEDTSTVSKAEAEAFIKLYHETDEVVLYRPIRDGKFLFFFDAYKIMTEDQYAYY